MPAQSEKQSIAARIARGIQKGEVKPKAGTASAEMAKMDPSSLKDFTKMEEGTNTSKPDAVKKVVAYLAKKAEEHQNYVGVDAPHDVQFETIQDIVNDSKNKNLQSFWNGLSGEQQDKVFNMIRRYLINKDMKENPDSYEGEQVEPVNYTLPAKKTAQALRGDDANKVVDLLAKKAYEWANYVDTDSPSNMDYYSFVEGVIDSKTVPKKIVDMWKALDNNKRKALFSKVMKRVEEKYEDVSDEDGEGYFQMGKLSEMAKMSPSSLKHFTKTEGVQKLPKYESIKLSNMAKGILEEARKKKTLKKEVDEKKPEEDVADELPQLGGDDESNKQTPPAPENPPAKDAQVAGLGDINPTEQGNKPEAGDAAPEADASAKPSEDLEKAKADAVKARAELEKAKAEKDQAEKEIEQQAHVKLVSKAGVSFLLSKLLGDAVEKNNLDALAGEMVDKLKIQNPEDFQIFSNEMTPFKAMSGIAQLLSSMKTLSSSQPQGTETKK